MTLGALIGSSPRTEKVANGFTAAAGPVFSRLGFLLFTDAANGILQWRAGTVKPFGQSRKGVKSLTFDHQGRLLACEQNRITRIEKNGRITVLADAFEGNRLTGINDLVYAIDGSIYFTAMPHAVYQITRNHQLRLATSDCGRASGVALAANQQRLLVADAGEGNVRVFDIHADGALSKGRIFCTLTGGAPGGLGGLKTDEAGNVWVAGPGGILVFEAGGEQLGTVPLPDAPSNCTWGAGFRDLYVTAQTSIYRISTQVSGTRTF